MNAPACTRLFQPHPLYSSPSRKQLPRAGKHLRARRTPHLPLAARRVALPVSAWPPGTPSAVKIPGSVGAPPCPADARSACAGSLLLGRRCGAAPALAAVPSAACRPRQAARNGVRISGPARLAGPLRGMRAGSPLVRGLWSGPCGPALPVRLPSSQVLVQDGADGGRDPGGVPAVPGGPADQSVGDDAPLLLGVALPAAVGHAHTTARRRRSRRHPGRCPGRRSPSPRRTAGQPGLQIGAGLQAAPQQVLRDAVPPGQLADVGLAPGTTPRSHRTPWPRHTAAPGNSPQYPRYRSPRRQRCGHPRCHSGQRTVAELRSRPRLVHQHVLRAVSAPAGLPADAHLPRPRSAMARRDPAATRTRGRHRAGPICRT